MSKQWNGKTRFYPLAAAVLAMAVGSAAPGQEAEPQPQQQKQTLTQPAPELTPEAKPAPKPETAMTPAQARRLFRSVDTIFRFDSQDTRLPIKHPVKRRLTTRRAVERFLLRKMKEDKDTARVERSSIVMKKFGLLPPEFDLRPFMLSLLKEQIAGFYDSKTKTVNLLNWIDPEEQKPVLAHELTHALQDQHVDLDKWGDPSYQAPGGTPKNVRQDNRTIRTDEADTAREAVLEGQAMVAYMDWSLAPMAQSLRTSPDVPLDPPATDDKPDPDSPVLSSAPLVLRASLLFPYQDGLRFAQTLLKDHGAHAAFAAVLDRPPSSSWEIMHPHAYEQHERPALLTLPDLHPLLDPAYTPYDLGVMGDLDVRMLGELFGGAGPAADLALAWDGGVYYAAQSRSAVAAGEGDSTASIGLIYLSQWTTQEAAQSFAKLYESSLSRKYKRIRPETAPGGLVAAAAPKSLLKNASKHRARRSQMDSQEECTRHVVCGSTEKSVFQQAPKSLPTSTEMWYATEEGPVVITTSDRQVFVSEGFSFDLADSLQQRMLGANGEKLARSSMGDGNGDQAAELTAPLVRLFGSIGMMKAALKIRPVSGPQVY